MRENSYMVKALMENEGKNLVLLKKTIGIIEELLKEENLDFMFIKLYRGLSYAPRDVDVLINPSDMRRAISIFRRNGFKVQTFSNVEIQCEREDLLKVDLYSGFCYLSLPFIDNSFLWRKPRKVDIEGFDCSIPSCEADFLSLVIHSLLGHRRLSLLDFLYAKNLFGSQELSINKMLKETEKFRWTHAFTKVFHTLKALHASLYLSPESSREIHFPLVYSTKFTFEAFQGFAFLNMRTKFLFTLSAFLDATYHKYLDTWELVPLEIPKQLKKTVAKSLYKIREYRGDSKTIHEKY